MAIFGRKPWVNPFGKMSIFPLLELIVFIAQKGVFSFHNIVKDIFLPCIAYKKKVGKMAIFAPKAWVNPFGKMNFLIFLSQKGVFFVAEYGKTDFSALYCLKIKVGKMAIFGPKQWVNPFGKLSIFRLFELLVFIAQKGFVSFHNIVKDIFLPCIAQKKQVGKMTIFAPKAWLNPFGKILIFRLFEHLVFISQKGVFLLQNIVKDIFLAYTAKKKKVGKNAFF